MNFFKYILNDVKSYFNKIKLKKDAKLKPKESVCSARRNLSEPNLLK